MITLAKQVKGYESPCLDIFEVSMFKSLISSIKVFDFKRVRVYFKEPIILAGNVTDYAYVTIYQKNYNKLDSYELNHIASKLTPNYTGVTTL